MSIGQSRPGVKSKLLRYAKLRCERQRFDNWPEDEERIACGNFFISCLYLEYYQTLTFQHLVTLNSIEIVIAIDIGIDQNSGNLKLRHSQMEHPRFALQESGRPARPMFFTDVFKKSLAFRREAAFGVRRLAAALRARGLPRPERAVGSKLHDRKSGSKLPHSKLKNNLNWQRALNVVSGLTLYWPAKHA